MKKLLFLVLLLSTFCTFSQTNNITGRVINPNTNKGSDFIRISIPQLKKWTLTNDSGYYYFDNLPNGIYNIQILDSETDSIYNKIDTKNSISSNPVIYFPHLCTTSKTDSICPKCSSSKNVVPVLHGCPMDKKSLYLLKTGKAVLGPGPVTNCAPFWHCKKHNLKF